MRYLILILLFSFSAFGQGPMYKASLQQAANACENLYTEQNAINDCDEANDVSGITKVGATAGTASSSTSFTDTGAYSARFLHEGGVNEALSWDVEFEVINGRSYQIDVVNYRDTGSNNWFLRLDSGDGWVTTITDRTTVLDGYETLSVTGVADITGTAVVVWNGTTGADGGDDNYWSSITVTDVTP